MDNYIPLIVAAASAMASLAVLFRARSEIRKNDADANRSAFEIMASQLKIVVETNEQLRSEIVSLRREIVALQNRVVELEGILDELKRTVPEAVADAIAARRKKPRRP
jgi:hypothetical protein